MALKELREEISALEEISSCQKEVLRSHGLLKGEDGKKIMITMRPKTDNNLIDLMTQYFHLRNIINEKKDEFCRLSDAE